MKGFVAEGEAVEGEELVSTVSGGRLLISRLQMLSFMGFMRPFVSINVTVPEKSASVLMELGNPRPFFLPHLIIWNR